MLLRDRIYDLLVQTGPLTSSDLAGLIGCSRSGAANAARELVTSGRARQPRFGGPFEAILPTPEQVERKAAWAEVAAASAKSEPAPPAAPLPAPTRPPQDDGRLPLDRIAEEAAALAPGLFGYLLWVDAMCIASGRPALSPWWRSRYALRGFYESGKRWGVFCVGRGGGKSTSLEEVAATDSNFEPRIVPPGQIWAWPFISTNLGDATRRLRGIASINRAIGRRFAGEYYGGDKAKEGIRVSYGTPAHMDMEDARGNAIQLLSLAGTIGNVSGPSTIGATIDEAAKLYDRAENANPLTEVIASLTQTFRARHGIRGIICSSAFDRENMHFKLIEQGDTDTNFVARIGAAFLDDALRGFEQVAAWEQHYKRNPAGAAQIRTHAAALTALSPLVPTWVANPTLGHPMAQPWDGAALASRRELEAIPEGSDKLEGLTRTALWLRECGSLPMDRSTGFDARAQLVGLAEANAALARSLSGAPAPSPGPMPHPLAPPGDPRYAGPRAGYDGLASLDMGKIRLF